VNNHFILSLGRSGSNQLVDLINQHPNLLNYGEVLGEWIPMRRLQRRIGMFRNNDARWLDFLLKNRMPFYGAQAVRAMHQFQRGDRPVIKTRKATASLGVKESSLNLYRFGIGNYLFERPWLKIISLRRLSALDRTISSLMLRETGVVLADKHGPDTKRAPVMIEPARFVRVLNAVAEENAELDRITAALPSQRVYRITYEQIFTDPEALPRKIDELYRFLDVGSFEPRIRMRKILPRNPAEVIANFSDCRDAAVGAGLERLLS
jgi:sulfotransferase family protein